MHTTRRNILLGAGALVVARVVGQNTNPATGGSSVADTGIEFLTAKEDHKHQFFEKVTDVFINPPWAGSLELRKSGNICQFFLQLSNLTSNQSTLAFLPAEFTPLYNQMVLGSFVFAGNFWPVGVVFRNTGILEVYDAGVLIMQNSDIDAAGVFLLD